MNLKVTLEVQPEEDDKYLTPSNRMGLAKSAISQLLSQIREQVGVRTYGLYLILEEESKRMSRIDRLYEDWEGKDLAKERRETAAKELCGAKVIP